MICPKCKNKIPDNKRNCPICGSKLPEKHKTITKNALNKYIKEDNSNLVGGTITKDRKVPKRKSKKQSISKKSTNKYIKDANLNLVGGKLSEQNNTLIKLEKEGKITELKPINPKDYNSTIDYKEAKRDRKELLDSLKYSYKGSELNAKISPKDNVQRPSVFDTNREIQKPKPPMPIYEPPQNNNYYKVNNPKQVPIKQQPLQNEKAPIELIKVSKNKNKFINVEGNKHKRNFKTETGIFRYALVIAIWLIALIVVLINTNNDYSFKEQVNSNQEFASYDGVSKSGQTGNSSSEGYTAIIYDNQYLDKFTIKSEKDVYDLIRSDSLKQKNNCPQNIKKIENEIVNNYGITAVNLCEMNEDFALELRDVVKYIYESYPKARNYLTNLTLANVESGSSFIAAFMPIFTFSTSDSSDGYPVATKTQIILNAKYFLNPAKIKNSVSYGSHSGYFPKNATRSSTLAHEFGHYLSYVALLKHYETKKLNFVKSSNANKLYKVYEDFDVGTYSKSIIDEAYKRYKEETGKMDSFTEFRKSISEYAVAKDQNGKYIYDETIAEAFHDCYLNGDNASLASQYILQVLLERI